MSFKILYQDGNVAANLYSIAAYVDAFAEALGLKELNVNPIAFSAVAAALGRPDFPHRDGVEKASPFKKAANFFVWFVAEKPIIDDLPPTIIPPELKSITNYQNAIFAYHMAIDCLHGAELHKNGKIVILKNKIRCSSHFFYDFIDTYSAAVPSVHFKPLSLLFEPLQECSGGFSLSGIEV